MKKSKIALCFCGGCGCLSAIGVTAVAAVLIISSSQGDSLSPEQKWDYEYTYNYDALTEPPWLSYEEDLSQFEKNKEALEEAGGEIDGDFYKDIMEADIEDILAEVDETDEIMDSDTNTDTTTDTDDEEEDTSSLIYNDDYGFYLDLGKYAPKVSVAYNYPEWAEATYSYCYELTDPTYESYECGDGYVPIFEVTVFNDDQYMSEVIDSPYGDLYTLLDMRPNQNIMFSYPNGVLPDEAPSTQEFYDNVIESFSY